MSSRLQLAELTAFVTVAEHLSFTKAAAQAGIALPTMSQTIRSLEERLGVRLFNRTTRSVAPTEAGERLLGEIQPIVMGIDHALESVNLFRDKPIGTLRLAVSRPTATRRLAPLIQPFLVDPRSVLKSRSTTPFATSSAAVSTPASMSASASSAT
jgi:DNA-binding transcriptional LysR family regulator